MREVREARLAVDRARMAYLKSPTYHAAVNLQRKERDLSKLTEVKIIDGGANSHDLTDHDMQMNALKEIARAVYEEGDTQPAGTLLYVYMVADNVIKATGYGKK